MLANKKEKKKKTEIKATNLGFKYQDIRYNIFTLLIFSNFYSAGGSARVKDVIEHKNYSLSLKKNLADLFVIQVPLLK